MKRWSKLQKSLYRLMDDKIEFQIHCIRYPMHSQRGSTDIPRYYITINKEIIWDYPKDFIHEITDKKIQYPYNNDISAISLLIEEYIQTSKLVLFDKKFSNDHWGLTNILKASDRRIGIRRQYLLLQTIQEDVVRSIILKRLNL